MPRQPRNTDPKFLRHISIRTLNAQLLLSPSTEVNDIVGGVIAKYQEIYGIEIFACNVLSNHIHILARAPLRNLWRFEQQVNREVAKRINRLRNRRGSFWGRRYDEQICPEPRDVLDAFLYVSCNAVSHGLIEDPSKWPGLNTLQEVVTGKEHCYPFTSYSAFNKAKKRARRTKATIRIEDFQTWHKLKITPLPEYEHMDAAEYRQLMGSFIHARAESLKTERQKEQKGFLGLERLAKQSCLQYPKAIKNFPRPCCYSKCVETKRKFKEWHRPWAAAYREASRKLRGGFFAAVFPPHCLLPPLHYAV